MYKRGFVGVKNTVVPINEKVPVNCDAPVIINEAWLMVAILSSSLKVTAITVVRGTLVAPLAGLVETTWGHNPGISVKLSFLHPANNATETMAIPVKIFLAFIVYLICLPQLAEPV